jgi:hypothetical protein
MEALLHVLDWLVENKLVGVPTACAVAALLGVAGRLIRRSRRERATFSAETITGKVQQVNVENLRSKGDINVTNRQE